MPPPSKIDASYIEVAKPSSLSIITVMGRIGAGAEIDAGVEQVPPEGYYDIEARLMLPSPQQPP